MPKLHLFRRTQLEQLECRCLLAGESIVISEFMADNEQGLKDSDGDFSDWLELHNPTEQRVVLTGWSLTDDTSRPDKWPLPELELPPGGHQLIFASGKDRRDVQAELHTNFKLSRDGEYLGLYDASGTAIHDYRPAYPPQLSDTSYGFAIGQQSLVSATDSPFKYLVPNAGHSGLQWKTVDFADQSWETATGTIGFDRRPVIPNAGFESNDFSNWETLGTARVDGGEIGQAASEGQYQAVISTSSSATRFGAESFLDLERFALDSVNGSVTRTAVMRRNFSVAAGDELAFDWNFLTNDLQRNDFAFVTLSTNGEVVKLSDSDSANDVSPTAFTLESGLARFRHTFTQEGSVTLGIGVAQLERNEGESVLLVDNLTLNGVGDIGSGFIAAVNDDIADDLYRVNASIWARHEFEVSDASLVTGLNLNVRYDDGFAAYLNGQLVAEANTPDVLNFDSTATRARASNLDALVPHTFQLQDPATWLVDGTNVLAVQGLNVSRDDTDFLLGVDVVAVGQVSSDPSFLAAATPGVSNLTSGFGLVEEVQFSHQHGFYDERFVLQLSTPTAGALIRYTTDGSEPTEENGIEYAGGISIDGTTIVRASGFRAGMIPERVATQTYLFLDDIIQQTADTALQDGYPSRWGDSGAVYGFDPRVIGPDDFFNDKYDDTIRDDLRAIPTLSIVMDGDDLFDRNRGIYARPEMRGVEWERPTSVELIYPDGAAGFQVNAGIRIQGGISRQVAQKLSLRLMFKDEYGPSVLEFPLFDAGAATTFDSISLRSSSGELVAPTGMHYIRDEFARRSQLATGHAGSHGNFVHLYLNGMYWGMYNPAERLDGRFAANYLGGDKDDYDILDAGTLENQRLSVAQGTSDAWNSLVRLTDAIDRTRSEPERTARFLSLEGRDADGTRNLNREVLLDVDNFIDYIITNLYTDNADWPFRNYVMVRRRGAASEGFQFFVWDAEFTLDSGAVANGFVRSIRDLSSGPMQILPSLLRSEAFRVRFSDRMQVHFSPGGAFYVNPNSPRWNPQQPQNNVPAARYAELVEEVGEALVAETARWGEQGRSLLFTRDEQWQRTANSNLNGFLRTRSTRIVNRMRNDGLFRDPPAAVPAPGTVPSGTPVSFVHSDGIIYYTVDGTDPMAADLSVSTSASRFREAFEIDSRTQIKARILDGDEWSALLDATYLVDAIAASATNLRVSEINYHPHSPFLQLGEMDLDQDQFEFIELANTTAQTVDLTGVRLVEQFGQGVAFEFGEQLLPAGGFVVIPRNRMAFESRYGDNLPMARGVQDDPLGWHYLGGLNNGGDVIKVVDVRGNEIQTFRFDDDGRWPQRADGDGSSLVVFDFHDEYSDPVNWEDSREFGGSPGRDYADSIPLITINEVLASSANDSDQIELFNLGAQPVDLSGWYVTDTVRNYLKFQFADGMTLGAGEYLTIDQKQLGFGLSGSQGDDVWLIQADARGRPVAFVDVASFAAGPLEVSMGRWPEGIGRFVPQRMPTLGQSNAGPILGDVNFDGRTNQLDLVQVAQRGKFLTNQRATFEDGDWNGDGRFDQLDFVAALRDGSFLPGFAVRDAAIEQYAVQA